MDFKTKQVPIEKQKKVGIVGGSALLDDLIAELPQKSVQDAANIGLDTNEAAIGGSIVQKKHLHEKPSGSLK